MPYIEPPEIEEVDNGEDQDDQKNWIEEEAVGAEMHEQYEESYL